MVKKQNMEKINPAWAAKKGRHPTQDSIENSRHHWRKVFYIDGIKMGKRVKKEFKKFTRDNIKGMDQK